MVIKGFHTEKIHVFADGALIEEHWVTHDVDLAEIEQVMEKVARGFSKEFRDEMKEGQEIYEKVKPFGFSILIRDHEKTAGLGGIDVLEVKRLEKKDLTEDIFLPPKGYEGVMPEPSRK